MSLLRRSRALRASVSKLDFIELALCVCSEEGKRFAHQFPNWVSSNSHSEFSQEKEKNRDQEIPECFVLEFAQKKESASRISFQIGFPQKLLLEFARLLFWFAQMEDALRDFVSRLVLTVLRSGWFITCKTAWKTGIVSFESTTSSAG